MRSGDLRSRRWGIGSVLAAGLFLAYLVALPPHLVHHAFDGDHGHPACPHLALSQHETALQPDAPTLAPAVESDAVHVLASRDPAPAFDPGIAPSRAPPRFDPFA